MKHLFISTVAIVSMAVIISSCSKDDDSRDSQSIAGVWYQTQTNPLFFSLENEKGTVAFMDNAAMPNTEFTANVITSITDIAPADIKTLEFKEVPQDKETSVNMSTIITYIDRRTQEENVITLPCIYEDGTFTMIFETPNIHQLKFVMKYRFNSENNRLELFGDGTMFPQIIERLSDSVPDNIKMILLQVKTIIEESDKVELGVRLEKR